MTKEHDGGAARETTGLVSEGFREWMKDWVTLGAKISKQTKTIFGFEPSLYKTYNLHVFHRAFIYLLYIDNYMEMSSLCFSLLQKCHRELS